MPSSKRSATGWVRRRTPKTKQGEKSIPTTTDKSPQTSSSLSRASARIPDRGLDPVPSSPPSAGVLPRLSRKGDDPPSAPFSDEDTLSNVTDVLEPFASHGLTQSELAVRAMIRGGTRRSESVARRFALSPPPVGSMEHYDTEEYPPHCYGPVTSLGMDPDTGLETYQVPLVVYTSPWMGRVTLITTTWTQRHDDPPAVHKATLSGGPPSRQTEEELNYWKDQWLQDARSKQNERWLKDNSTLLQSDQQLLDSHLASEREKFYSPEGWTRHMRQPLLGVPQGKINNEWVSGMGRLRIEDADSE